MKIGIDLDEVVVDFLEGLLDFYHRVVGKRFRREEFSSYDFWETWGGTREEAIEITDKFHQSEHFENIVPIEGAIDSIKRLSEKHEIFFITSRPGFWKEKTSNWLKKYFPKGNFKIIFSGDFHDQGRTKAEICEELEIPLMFEDNKHYALSCAERGIKVILFDKPWNKGFEHENLVRVHSWEEAVREVEKLDNPLSQ